MSMGAHTFLLSAGLVAAVVLAAPAPAAANELVIWNVRPGKLRPRERKQLGPILEEAVKGLRAWEVVAEPASARKALGRLAKRCKLLDADCVIRAGEAMGVRLVLSGAVVGVGPRTQIELFLVDVEKRSEAARLRGLLRPKQLKADIEELVERLYAQSRPDAGSIVLAANVSGADVRLDGKLVGQTPLAAPLKEVAAGPHDLTLSHPDHETYAASVEVRPGAEVRLLATLKLRPVPPLAAAPEPPLPVSAPAASMPPEAAVPPAQELALAPPPTGPVEIVAKPIGEQPPKVEAAAPPAPASKAKMLAALGLHLDLLLPAAKTGGASYAQNLRPEGSRTATFAVMGEGRYSLPPPVQDLSIALEVGWYRLAAKGSRQNPDDPDFADIDYAWSLHTLPVLLGVYYQLPLPLPIDIAAGAGFVYERVWATTTYTAHGTSTQNATQSDAGMGFHATAEAGLPLGPGVLVGSVRYTRITTDLNFKTVYDGAYNEKPGDVGGGAVLVGYRYTFRESSVR